MSNTHNTQQSSASKESFLENCLEVKELVVTFNQIPRAFKMNDQINHWHFTIRNIPSGDAGAANDVIHIINPISRTAHIEGPTYILGLDQDFQSAVILRLLTKAFVDSISTESTPAVVPWSWGTPHANLAKALAAYFLAANLRRGLCRISFGNQSHIEIEEELWLEECERLNIRDKVTCRRCHRLPRDSPKLLRCSSCKQVQYCSKKCQQADWKGHKKFCQSICKPKADVPKISATLELLEGIAYHRRHSSKASDVQVLAKSMALKIPAGSIWTIVRRLVITGNDTPDNMKMFFGPYATDLEYIESMHHESRFEILLGSPKGSFHHVMAKSHDVDVNCPPWTPREANEDEQQYLDTVREIQKLIKRYMKARNRKLSSIDSEDMDDILQLFFDECWENHRPYYIAALNSMDMGYPDDYSPCRYKDESRTKRHWGISSFSCVD